MKSDMNENRGLIHQTRNNENGIALILVLGILAVLAVLATTFAFNARLEQKAARNYLDAVSADCIAKLGVEHAIALLHNDITDEPVGQCEGYDWNEDEWGYLDDDDSTIDSIFGALSATEHKDLDDYEPTSSDPTSYDDTDARWKGVWEDGVLVGRYAVLVIDESSKMNINTAGNIAHPTTGDHVSNEGWTTAEIDLEALSGFIGLGDDIVKYRYGGGATPSPGSSGDDDENNRNIIETDGIDNDGDGSIDESGAGDDEGDDEPDEFTPWYPRNSGGDDTAFSTIMEVRFVPGVTSVWDSVKNLITVQSRTRNQYWDSGWKPKLNINAVADVSKLSDLLDDAGVSGGPQGAAQKACNITDYRDENYIISAINSGGWIYGVEPILINEVLGKSYMSDLTSWTNDTSTWKPHTYSGLAPNTCYRIKITAGVCGAGNTTFNVRVNTAGIGTGGPEPISSSNSIDYGTASNPNLHKCRSDANGNITIETEDQTPAGDTDECVIAQVEFTCAEFVELFNLSYDNIDINGWTIDPGDGNDDSIPAGNYFGGFTSTINTGTYFVITNDRKLFTFSYGDQANDTGIWGDDASETTPVAVIAGWKDGYAPDTGELAESGNQDVLIKADGVEGLFADRACNYTGRYGNSARIGVSREKDDPTVRDGTGNNWSDNNKNLTPREESSPGAQNDRCSSTLSNIYIQSSPFASIGEMSDTSNSAPNFYKGVRSGSAWSAFSGSTSGSDLGLIAERITTDAVRLDAETVTPTNNDWLPTANLPYFTDSYRSPASNSGDWEWTSARLQPVRHMLYIYGLYANSSDTDYLEVTVWNYANGTWDATQTDLEYQPSDGVEFPIDITTGNISADGSFKIRLATDGTQSDTVYFDYLLLVPESVPGKVNLNTAALQVLQGLPGLDAASTTAAQNIYDSIHTSPEIPYQKLGDVLDFLPNPIGEFAPISNLISVHSDVFKIICLAQTIQDLTTTHTVDDPAHDDMVLAEKKIEVIVDRSALPSGHIRILSWKEIME